MGWLDTWVVAAFGDNEPRYVLAMLGVDKAIAFERARYISGQMSVEAFEQRVGELLAAPPPEPPRPPIPKKPAYESRRVA